MIDLYYILYFICVAKRYYIITENICICIIITLRAFCQRVLYSQDSCLIFLFIAEVPQKLRTKDK